MTIRDRIRNYVRRHVLPACEVRRVHIIGCARSGTTMLHYAMIAFEDTVLCEIESGVRLEPSLSRSLSLAATALRTRQKIYYITKRDYGWFEEDALSCSIDYIKKERIGIINVIRDPRDVLVSKHAGAPDSRKFYVSPERWRISVAAGEYIVDRVKDFTPAITLRYEDLVRTPEQAEKTIADTFGLRKRPHMKSLARLRDNIEIMGMSTEPWMAEAMHKIRNFDDRSISVWTQDEQKKAHINSLLASTDPISHTLQEFIQRHRY